MEIFLSWSKEYSRKHAEAFRDWLPNVIQNTKLFMSSQDIALGEQGIEKIEEKLSKYSFGILFVTQENRDAPWLLYEAGALSRSISDAKAKVVPILVDLDRENIVGSPLSLYQNAQGLSKENFQGLCRSINESNPNPLETERLDRIFEKFWPELSESFSKIQRPSSEVQNRSVPEQIEKILTELLAIRDTQSTHTNGIVQTMSSIEDVLQFVRPSLFGRGGFLSSLRTSGSLLGGEDSDKVS